MFLYFLFVVLGEKSKSLFTCSYSSNGKAGACLVLSFIFLLCSVVTDYFDGHLARKWRCESNFGAVFDPLADKILVSSFLVLFSFSSLVHWIIPFLSIAREITVELVRYKLKSKGVYLGANKTAKWKTAIQFVGVVLGFLLSDTWGKEILNVFFIISLLFSFNSLAKYLKIYWDHFERYR
nr:CDP-diacylglycerol--glycerol-3-phosphate 3-phosphatidyltransferase [Mycoplasma wenyonii]